MEDNLCIKIEARKLAGELKVRFMKVEKCSK